MSTQTTMGYIRQWHRMGVCYVSAVAPRPKDGRLSLNVYRMGNGADVRAQDAGNPKPWVSAITSGVLIQHLDGVHTLDELLDLTGLSEAVLRRTLRIWRDVGAIYIADWEDGYVGSIARPMYAMKRYGRPAIEPDRPQKMSNAQRMREQREKAKAIRLHQVFAGNVQQYREAA